MSVVGTSKQERLCSTLVARVRSRQLELQREIFARVRDSAHGREGSEDADYVEGLRSAVAAAVEHVLAGIEQGEQVAGAPPSEVLVQARRAVRAGVSLDTVLRRYMLGSMVVGDFLMQEAELLAERDGGLREALTVLATVLDRLTEAVTDEYKLERERLSRSTEQHRVERVLRLLASGRAGSLELGYELDGWHLGVLARVDRPAEALRDLAASVGRALLCVTRAPDTAWAWLGGPSPLEAAELAAVQRIAAQAGIALAVGEPARGIDGWRLTHRQAQAAMRVALLHPVGVTRYSDVALVASVLHDEALVDSLVEIYLSPLGERQNGGAVLRDTLRAYFAAERNASSAASALGVTRHTVEKRLRVIEEKLGQRLRARQAELEVALRLEDLNLGARARLPDSAAS